MERRGDERGWFARTFDAEEFRSRGMKLDIVQANASSNARAATLRGMHFQRAPHGEPKLVRCTRGAAWDVVVDLREDSPSYCRWFGIELSADNGQMLFIPEGLAHGFQTLEDHTELAYQMGALYVPESATGVRWDDPAFGIEWPEAPGGRTITERDLTWPDFRP